MSKFMITVSGSHLIEADSYDEAMNMALSFKNHLDLVDTDGDFQFRLTSFPTHRSWIVQEARKSVPVIVGRQETEGIIQSLVRMLVQGGFVNDEIMNVQPELMKAGMKADTMEEGKDRTYSADFETLYERTLPYAKDASVYARDFKGVVADILLNSSVGGGSTFMKEAKKQG